MRWLLVVVAVGACDAGERPATGPRADEIVQAELAKVPIPPIQPPNAPIPAGPLPPPIRGQDELDAIARAVLVRYQGTPDTMPDGGLIAGKPQYVMATTSGTCPPEWEACPPRTFTAAAMPSSKFQLRTHEQLYAEAKRTNDNVYYIYITGVEIKGTEATLTVGVDFMMPEQSGGKLCCCSATQVWTKQNGRWTYKKTISEECS